jgi:hypothetical protein
MSICSSSFWSENFIISGSISPENSVMNPRISSTDVDSFELKSGTLERILARKGANSVKV